MVLNDTTLSIVIPLYNSEANIGPLIEDLVLALRDDIENFEIILVNDGSTDQTHMSVLNAQTQYKPLLKYIRLAKNFGEHNAVLCGLHHSIGEIVVIIDDDLQNPSSDILPLVKKLQEGFDVVYSQYDKKYHSWFRNVGSKINDLFATLLTSKPAGLYLSSFKAMNRFAVNTVVSYSGPYPYLDNLILQSTNNIGQLKCTHRPRRSGKSGYTLGRLLALWLTMSTGASIIPLRVASVVGLIMAFIALCMAIFFATSRFYGGLLFENPMPPGWASLIVSLTFFSGLQLCVLGVAGEYLGRLYMSASWKPQFVVRDTFGFGEVEAEHEDDKT